MKNDEYFMLFANCIPVNGVARSAIYDLQNGMIKLIPNVLFDVLMVAREKSIESVKEHFDHKMDAGIDRYFSLLESEGLGFKTDSPTVFPALSNEWHTPSDITNAIIDITESSKHVYDKIITELGSLGCEALQFRFFDIVSENFLSTILNYLQGSRIISVEVLIKYDPNLVELLPDILQKHVRVRSVIIHSSPTDQEVHLEKSNLTIIYSTTQIKDASHCGQVSVQHFVANINSFTESLHFNSCLNRKISIDAEGKIRNCPSMSTDYGDSRVRHLKEVVSDPSFRKVWSIRKDDINVCKVCEFRYACTDCRAYISDSKDVLSKPLKCGYDPHTLQWNEHSLSNLRNSEEL